MRKRTDRVKNLRADFDIANAGWSQLMSIGPLLLIILLLALFGVIPIWGHSKRWGYAPSGVVGLLAAVLVVMLLTGRL